MDANPKIGDIPRNRSITVSFTEIEAEHKTMCSASILHR